MHNKQNRGEKKSLFLFYKEKTKDKVIINVTLLMVFSLFMLFSLKSATTTAAFLAGAVCGDGSDILDSANLDPSTGKSAESGLGTRAGSLEVGTASGPQLDVESVDPEELATGSNVLSSKHSGVGRVLITVSLNLHTTSDADDGLTARDVGDMDESVVVGSVDVSNRKVDLTVVRAGAHDELFLISLLLKLGLLGHFLKVLNFCVG